MWGSPPATPKKAKPVRSHLVMEVELPQKKSPKMLLLYVASFLSEWDPEREKKSEGGQKGALLLLPLLSQPVNASINHGGHKSPPYVHISPQTPKKGGEGGKEHPFGRDRLGLKLAARGGGEEAFVGRQWGGKRKEEDGKRRARLV